MKRLLQTMFTLLLIIVLITSCEQKESGLPVDGDGNVYDTVVIGTQTWLKQNLKTTKYYNGVSIPLVTGNTEWTIRASAAFCWYNNDSKYKEIYGALYNWYTVRAGTLCPIGYHVPTDTEWSTLKNYLGELMGGAKLKDNYLGLWNHNNCATNESGFSARPAGGRSNSDGEFYNIGAACWWWSSTLGSFNWNSDSYGVWDGDCLFYKQSANHINGHSVRCIKN